VSAVFEAAIPVLMAHEGGWVDNPKDRGRETIYGLSLAVVIPNLGLTAADLGIESFVEPGCLKAVTRERGVEAWRTHLWERFGFAQLLDQGAATKLFDTRANLAGYDCTMAFRLAQKMLGLTVDGLLGPRTLGAINDAGAAFEAAYAEALELHYRRIVAVDPTQAGFLEHWLLRARCVSSARCRLHRHP